MQKKTMFCRRKKERKSAFEVWLEKKKKEDAQRIALVKDEKRKSKEAEEAKYVPSRVCCFLFMCVRNNMLCALINV